MTDVVAVVNSIGSRELHHCAFKVYVEEVDSEYEGVIYFSKVRWLSKAATWIDFNR